MRHTAIILICLLGFSMVSAQEAKTIEADAAKINRDELYSAFTDLLQKSALVGTFMVDKDPQGNRKPERYEISKIVKQSQGDYWNFFARIKYGDHDVTLPLPVEVKWAGNTPVITVDNLTIPGMGTFDARVVISDNKYAGTWRHGRVGGLMFGRIEKQKVDLKDGEEVAKP